MYLTTRFDSSIPTLILSSCKNKDFFYICVGHLSDRGFCQPDAEEAAALTAKKKQDELDSEIAKVKKEYDEKQKLKREKRKSKDEKDKKKSEESKSTEEQEDKDDEKARDDKVGGWFCVTSLLT